MVTRRKYLVIVKVVFSSGPGPRVPQMNGPGHLRVYLQLGNIILGIIVLMLEHTVGDCSSMLETPDANIPILPMAFLTFAEAKVAAPPLWTASWVGKYLDMLEGFIIELV